MKPSVGTVVCVAVCVACSEAFAAEDFSSVVDHFSETLGRASAYTFEYEGIFFRGDATQVEVTGKVTYKDGFRVIADATLRQDGSTQKHIVRSDGQTLYEGLIADGKVSGLKRADLEEIREYFGEDFLPFTIDQNAILHTSLLASAPLLASFYEFSFVNTYRVSGRELAVYEAAITSDLMKRAGRVGGNPIVATLTFLAGRAGRIWFYFGPDDGLLYRLEVFRRGGGGVFLSVDFSGYQGGVHVDDADFLYDPPADAEVHDLSEELQEGILKYNRSLARVSMKPGDRVAPTRLTPAAGFPMSLGSFRDAVMVILWENVQRDSVNTRISDLNEMVAKEVGKPIYCVILTTRNGDQIDSLVKAGISFPIVGVGRKLEEDPVALSLRLLDASSRVIVIKPGLHVSAVIPCDNPKWPELARTEYSKLLEGDE